MIRLGTINGIATITKATCLTSQKSRSSIPSICEFNIPEYATWNSKHEIRWNSVHLGFSDRIRAKVSKGRFISLLGKWHRFPFDGQLFPTQLDRALVLQAPPFIINILKVTIGIHGRHVLPTFSFLWKYLGQMRRKARVFYFFLSQVLQVVSVTQSVCLIARMLPTQYWEQIFPLWSSLISFWVWPL